MERLRKVFELLRDDDLTLNAKKCVFFGTEVTVLGHRISAEGIKPLRDKVESVENWNEPRNKKEVRSFLGLAGYYRQFVKDFAKIAAPLHKLTGKNCQWQWSEREVVAFQELKQVLIDHCH